MISNRKYNTTQRAGLTLIELLVTLTIIAAMILAFSTILASSQKVISSSQALMRSNAAAEAVARAIRLDFQAITSDGFLFIGNQELVLTTAGYYTSQRAGSLGDDDSTISDKISGMGLGRVIVYGRCANPADTSLSAPILFRYPLVFSKEWFDGNVPRDVWNVSQGSLLAKSVGELEATANDLIDAAPDAISVPSENTFASVDNLWVVMSHRTSDLDISYATDFKADGSLNWQTPPDGGKIWTHHDRSTWPLAIRFRFRIQDKAWPDEFAEDALMYEVICSIGS